LKSEQLPPAQSATQLSPC